MSSDADRAIHEPVVLVPWQDGWPVGFEAEKERLLQLFPGRFIAIEHFGSTAIRGMPAKPVIDLLAGVASMAEADALFEPLLQHGYTTSREFNAMLPDRRWFMRAAGGSRTHHLHVVVFGGAPWRDRLRLRDALRADPALAARYAGLKQQLAATHRDDREAYTEGKDAFVAQVLAG